jgi:hypothetical protein
MLLTGTVHRHPEQWEQPRTCLRLYLQHVLGNLSPQPADPTHPLVHLLQVDRGVKPWRPIH